MRAEFAKCKVSKKLKKKTTKRPCLLKSEEALPARHSLNLDLIPNSGGFLLLLLLFRGYFTRCTCTEASVSHTGLSWRVDTDGYENTIHRFFSWTSGASRLDIVVLHW